jgi:hypothetical protein
MPSDQAADQERRTNRGRVPRTYHFNIEDPKSTSEDAKLARKWGCVLWGRGGTRFSLYGLLKHPEEKTSSGEPLLVVSLVQESGLVAVTSVRIVQDFIRASADLLSVADTGNTYTDEAHESVPDATEFTKNLLWSVDSIACEILSEDPAQGIDQYHEKVTDLAEQLHTLCTTVGAVFD